MIHRVLFFLVFVVGGYIIGVREGMNHQGLLWGAGVGIIALILEYVLTMIGFGSVLCGLAGLAIGLLFAELIYHPLKTIFTSMDGAYIAVMFNAVFGYSGLLLGLKAGKDFTLANIV
ncbi:MAG: hypothetical protein JSU90_10515, partial [Nitrospiraceae bacterium]